MWGLEALSWLSGRGESEGSPDPTVCDEESEKIEVGDEERNEVGESCEDDDVAGDTENENGMASDGDGDWDLDGDHGEGDRDVVMNKDCMGAEEGASVGEADVDSDVDRSMPSDTVVVIDVSSSALVVGAAAVVVVNCPFL